MYWIGDPGRWDSIPASWLCVTRATNRDDHSMSVRPSEASVRDSRGEIVTAQIVKPHVDPCLPLQRLNEFVDPHLWKCAKNDE